MKKKWKVILGSAVALMALIQFVPVQRVNPPVGKDLTASPDVKALLVTSCYDCHSHQTRWPWYSRVAPVSWLVASDVKEGRAHLNFSEWGSYPEDVQGLMKTEMYKLAQDGEMPPLPYRLIHHSARVSPAGLDLLKQWGTPGTAVRAP